MSITPLPPPPPPTPQKKQKENNTHGHIPKLSYIALFSLKVFSTIGLHDIYKADGRANGKLSVVVGEVTENQHEKRLSHVLHDYIYPSHLSFLPYYHDATD